MNRTSRCHGYRTPEQARQPDARSSLRYAMLSLTRPGKVVGEGELIPDRRRRLTSNKRTLLNLFGRKSRTASHLWLISSVATGGGSQGLCSRRGGGAGKAGWKTRGARPPFRTAILRFRISLTFDPFFSPRWLKTVSRLAANAPRMGDAKTALSHVGAVS